MNGHGTGEAWGLALTTDQTIISTGDDNKIVHFDPKTNKTINTGTVNNKAGKKYRILGASTLSSFPPNQCSRCVAVNKANGNVVIATNEGEISVRESKDNLDSYVK